MFVLNNVVLTKYVAVVEFPRTVLLVPAGVESNETTYLLVEPTYISASVTPKEFPSIVSTA